MLDKALADFRETSVENHHTQVRRAHFLKFFKQASREERRVLIAQCFQCLLEEFNQQRRIDSLVFTFVAAIAQERDWESALRFVDVAVDQSNVTLHQDMAIILLNIADIEFEEKANRIPIGPTALVLLTELGLHLARKSPSASMDFQSATRVVDYITSNLISRSNQNSLALRLSLVHFLSQASVIRGGPQQLHRMISRFGQSLLDSLLSAYFEDKKKLTAAFYFLSEHMNTFYQASPALADMCQNMLRHYMLRFPAEFPQFLSTWCEHLPRESEVLQQALRNMSQLLKSALDIGQKPLAEAISRLLMAQLELYRPSGTENFVKEVQYILELLGRGDVKGNLLAEDTIRKFRLVLSGALQANGNLVSITKARKLQKEPPIKSARIGERPSPLESVLLLAVH